MIASKALRGEALDDIFIFDAHGHIDSTNNVLLPDNDPASMLKTLDRVGVNAICVSSCAAFDTYPDMGNDNVIAAAQKFPGRFFGYAVPTPHYDYDVSKYFYEGSGMIGVKIHASIQQTAITNPNFDPAYEFADKHGLPILYHTWNEPEVKCVHEVAKRYKNAKHIIAHSAFTNYGAKLACIEAIKECENVFVDTAISMTYDGTIEWIVDKVGVDRVLFGTDLSFFDCRQTVGKLALSRLSDGDKIKIFGENAKKVFDLKGFF